MAQCRQCGTVELGGAVGAEELARRDQQGGLGAREDVGGLGGGVAGVQWDDDGAGVVGGQCGHHPVPGVRAPDGDPVADRDAQVDHGRRGTSYFIAQLAVSEAFIGRDQGVMLG